MEENKITKFPLNFQLNPTKLDFGNFSLLSDVESDRTPCSSFAIEINELKAQLDIVNEDRERLKKESERLRQERDLNMYKFIVAHSENGKASDNEKISTLQQ